jgi:N-acetylneuraminic acid mutarotase
MKLKNLFLFSFLFVVACERYEPQGGELAYTDSWVVDFGLASGNCVVYDDTLYVLFGREEGGSAEVPSQKLRYAPISNLSNFKEIDLPISPRVKASAIVVDGHLYAGLGFCGKVYANNSLLTDWWVYDFSSKIWTKLRDCPVNDVVAPVVWSDENYIYFSFGFNSNFSKSIYRYDIFADMWELYSETSEPWIRANALGEKVGNCIYLGGGAAHETKKDWWCYDWQNNEWSERSSMPSRGRVFASSAVIGDNIYILGGRYFGGTETREYFYETILWYDVDLDEWFTLGRMEQAVENMIAFECNGDLYWGLGQCQNGSFVKKIYKRNMRFKN